MTALDDWHKEHLSPTAIAMFEAWKEAEQAVPRDEAQCEHALRELLAQVIDDLMEAKGLHQRSSALGRAPREMGPYLPSGQVTSPRSLVHAQGSSRDTASLNCLATV